MRTQIVARPELWPVWWTAGVARPWPGDGQTDIPEHYRDTLLTIARWKVEGDRCAQHLDAVQVPVENLGDSTWSEAFHVWET